MSFDNLASYYDLLESLFAQGDMQRARLIFLSRTRHCRQALLVGEGSGKFLAELLASNPQVQVTCIEQCAGMIERQASQLRKRNLNPSRVTFCQMDVLDWQSLEEKYDLVVTQFFLDCFQPWQLKQLVPKLVGSMTEDAIWLLADFRVPARGWQKWRALVILGGLYHFFKWATDLSADRLTAPEPYLGQAGVALVERKLMSCQLVHSDLWRRKAHDSMRSYD